MAVAPPTPPTPPSPPTVPQVKLQEKGSTTESTVPSKEKDHSPEAQARSSVAQGNGSLSKTTTTNPNESREQQRDSNNKAQQTSDTPQTSTNNQVITQVPPLMDANDLLTDRSNTKKQSQQSTASALAQYDDNTSSSGHGSFYFAFSAIALIILAFVAFSFINKKKNSRGLGGISAKKPKPELNLTGQTAEEVMKALQAQHLARAKSSSPSNQGKENPISAAVANQYLSQSKQKPDKQNKQSTPITEKPRTIRRNKKSDKEESHFEIRI